MRHVESNAERGGASGIYIFLLILTKLLRTLKNSDEKGLLPTFLEFGHRSSSNISLLQRLHVQQSSRLSLSY